MDITHDNVCSVLSCFYSYLLSTGRPISSLELKAVLLALKEFQDLCSNNIVLVVTDNTTVLAYINKEGG